MHTVYWTHTIVNEDARKNRIGSQKPKMKKFDNWAKAHLFLVKLMTLEMNGETYQQGLVSSMILDKIND